MDRAWLIKHLNSANPDPIDFMNHWYLHIHKNMNSSGEYQKIVGLASFLGLLPIIVGELYDRAIREFAIIKLIHNNCIIKYY